MTLTDLRLDAGWLNDISNEIMSAEDLSRVTSLEAIEQHASPMKAQCGVALTQRVVHPICLLLHLFIKPLHVLHQQGHHLSLQLEPTGDTTVKQAWL